MTRRMLTITGAALLSAALLLGLLVVTIPGETTVAIDTFWNGVMASIRQPWMMQIASFMNWIGGGWRATLLVPVLIIVALVIARRMRAAAYAVVAFAVSAGAVQLLKHLFSRVRPEDMLVTSDFGSFPSGHSANAATIAVVLWIVVPRVWTAIVGAAWIVVMALSRTILAVHWATDTIGGALVGAAVALLVAASFLHWASLGWGAFHPTPRSSRAADPPLS